MTEMPACVDKLWRLASLSLAHQTGSAAPWSVATRKRPGTAGAL